MVAHRDAAERQFPVLFRNGDQTEVGRAAAHVANQNQVADLDSFAPGVAVSLDPGVESGLRLFQQRDSTQPRLLGGAQRQFARLFIERGRDGQEDFLLAEASSGFFFAIRLSHMLRRYSR